jgi:hypothetical protein
MACATWRLCGSTLLGAKNTYVVEKIQRQLGSDPNNMLDYFGIATIFLLFLDFIPVRVLGLSFFAGNILYGATRRAELLFLGP